MTATETLGILSYVSLPLIGFGVLRLRRVRELALDGRIAIATASGALILAIALFVLSVIHVRWTPFIVGAIAIASVWSSARSARQRRPERPSLNTVPVIAIIVLLALAAFFALSARMTCTDVSYFWAPKGIAFARAGAIDVSFLRNPDHYFMHSDYPPLLPIIYAWSTMISGQFAWFAALFSSVLFFACIVALIRSASGDDHGTVLVAAILMYALGYNYTAGCADPLLLLFETMTLVSLTFERASSDLIAAIGLCGAVWTKVEGAPFVVAIGIACAVARVPLRRITRIVAPSIILLASWIAFAAHHSLLDAYRLHGRIYWSSLPTTIALLAQHASFGTFWLPWLAIFLMIAIGINRRAAALPLIVGALNFGAIIYVYVHDPDPAFWIHSSANRTLLPPLLAFCVAALKAGAPEPRRETMEEIGIQGAERFLATDKAEQ